MPKKSKAKSSQKKVASKKSTSKTAVAKNVAAPSPTSPAPPIAAAPVVKNEVVLEPSVLEQHNLKFMEILKNIQTLKVQLTEITSQVKNLQKNSERETKKLIKLNKKHSRKSKNRAPSGFVKPALISKELASFLGKPVGTEMARTEVTREINTYIRSHKLQDPNNGRIIKADTKLRKLLNLKKDEELTYFNLQRYMSPHFAKKGQPLLNQ